MMRHASDERTIAAKISLKILFFLSSSSVSTDVTTFTWPISGEAGNAIGRRNQPPHDANAITEAAVPIRRSASIHEAHCHGGPPPFPAKGKHEKTTRRDAPSITIHKHGGAGRPRGE